MKKAWLIFFVLIIIAVSSIYILIPNNIVINKTVYANCASASVLRCLHSNEKWHQWFPGKSINDTTFNYKNQQYILGTKSYISTEVSIEKNNADYASSIDIVPYRNDTSAIQWRLQFNTSFNPFKRFEQYQTAKKIKNNLTVLLDSFKRFTENAQNIYDFDIKRTTLTDTALVSLKTVTKQYPSTELIYTMINKLKQYIKEQHATEHNFPMLNVTQLNDSTYDVMTGVPTNILLKGNNTIKPKRMIMLKNKTLVTEVTGDTSAINKALQAVDNYMSDNQLASPVIPFQQLVTDRSKEKDSTKWVTRIFFPII